MKKKASAAEKMRGTLNTEKLPDPAPRDIAQKLGWLQLSDIQYRNPKLLHKNTRNKYPPLPPGLYEELKESVYRVGILVPLVIRPDGTLVCGENRTNVAIMLGIEKVPVQIILNKPLTSKMEQEIMHCENDLRRGWTAEQKKEYAVKNFKREIEDSSVVHGQSAAETISKASRGQISRASAKKIVAEVRKEKGLVKSSSRALTKAALKKAESALVRLLDLVKKQKQKIADLKKQLKK